MSPATVVVTFYGLLAVATVILRGDLTNWPRWADRIASFAVAWSAVVLLVGSWRPTHPAALPPVGPPARRLPAWPWWAGVLGFLAFVYLAALPPVSQWLAQPRQIERSTPGHDATEPAEAKPAQAGNDPATSPEGGSPRDEPGGDPSASSSFGRGLSGVVGRVRSFLSEKPPWLLRLAIAAALLLIGVLAWLLWRLLRPSNDRSVPPPGQQPVWFEEKHAPRYVREFARLCHRAGSPPRPSDTFRDLLAQLSQAGHDVIDLMPMTAYHYRVRYENAPRDRSAEQSFTRRLRVWRAAPSAAQATGTTTAA